MKQIATAGNTVVPALLALESLGFTLSVEKAGAGELFRAVRGEEIYVSENPVGVLGLVKLIEMRGWSWQPTDVEIEDTLGRYQLG